MSLWRSPDGDGILKTATGEIIRCTSCPCDAMPTGPVITCGCAVSQAVRFQVTLPVSTGSDAMFYDLFGSFENYCQTDGGIYSESFRNYADCDDINGTVFLSDWLYDTPGFVCLSQTFLPICGFATSAFRGIPGIPGWIVSYIVVTIGQTVPFGETNYHWTINFQTEQSGLEGATPSEWPLPPVMSRPDFESLGALRPTLSFWRGSQRSWRADVGGTSIDCTLANAKSAAPLNDGSFFNPAACRLNLTTFGPDIPGNVAIEIAT